MNAATVRSALVGIVVRASARGIGGTLTPAEADASIERMLNSDDAPDWSAIREGRDDMARLVSWMRRNRGEHSSALCDGCASANRQDLPFDDCRLLADTDPFFAPLGVTA